MRASLRATLRASEKASMSVSCVVDWDGDTILHRVCSAGKEQLAYLLLLNGADANTVNNSKQTPFLLAAKSAEVGNL